jgi:hypothetical protein
MRGSTWSYILENRDFCMGKVMFLAAVPLPKGNHAVYGIIGKGYPSFSKPFPEHHLMYLCVEYLV